MRLKRYLAISAVLMLTGWVVLACAQPTSTPSGGPTKAPVTAVPFTPPKAAPAATAVPTVVTAAPTPTCPPNNDVAILIVDDFATPVPSCEPPDSLRCVVQKHGIQDCDNNDNDNDYCRWKYLTSKMGEDLKDENCLFTPSGQAYFAGSGAAYFAGSGAQKGMLSSPVAHGELVYAQLEQLRQKDNNNPQIQLFRVPAPGYTTEAITKTLDTALYELQKKCYRRFVLNMSFVILPCDVMFMSVSEYTDALRKSPYKDIESQLAGLTDEQKLAQFRFGHAFGQFRLYMSYMAEQEVKAEQKVMSCQNDPLCRYLNLKASSGQVISVGAAGNVTVTFPYAPAVWPMVVSVSAGPTDKREYYSSAGEVQMQGQLSSPITLSTGTRLNIFTLFDPQRSITATANSLYGTSFAAPELSYQEALYLLKGGPVPCNGNQGKTSPPLKYVPTPTAGAYLNLPLDKAAYNWCAGFPTPTP